MSHQEVLNQSTQMEARFSQTERTHAQLRATLADLQVRVSQLVNERDTYADEIKIIKARQNVMIDESADAICTALRQLLTENPSALAKAIADVVRAAL